MGPAPPGTIPRRATSSVLLSWFEIGWFSLFFPLGKPG